MKKKHRLNDSGLHDNGNHSKTVVCTFCKKEFTVSTRNAFMDAVGMTEVVKATCPHCEEDVEVKKPDTKLIKALQGQI